MSRNFCLLLSYTIALSSGVLFAEETVQEKLFYPLQSQTEKSTTESLTVEKSSSAFKPFAGKIVGNRVRLRNQPNLEAHVLREVNAGDLLTVIGEQDNFYAVNPPRGSKGYVFRTFILEGVVEGDRVNIRLSPDVDAPVIGQLRAGDMVKTSPCSANNKWLEIDLKEHSRFYVAKDFIENCGSAEVVAQKEHSQNEGEHLLRAAFHLAQGELQKPFEEINLDKIVDNFNHLSTQYTAHPDIVDNVSKITRATQDLYLQKKLAFLEQMADPSASRKNNELQQRAQHLAELGKNVGATVASEVSFAEEPTPSASFQDDGSFSLVQQALALTDKMRVWQPVEEALFHQWAAKGHEGSLDSYYKESSLNAALLTGIVEPYTKAVQNRPGDFILRVDNLPAAFLYSTRVNLQEMIGKKVTLVASPRPNNDFAFPAYFVLATD